MKRNFTAIKKKGGAPVWAPPSESCFRDLWAPYEARFCKVCLPGHGGPVEFRSSGSVIRSPELRGDHQYDTSGSYKERGQFS
jgi:hypothetical protein